MWRKHKKDLWFHEHAQLNGNKFKYVMKELDSTLFSATALDVRRSYWTMRNWYIIEISYHFVFEGKDIHNRNFTKILPCTLNWRCYSNQIRNLNNYPWKRFLVYVKKLKNNNFVEWRFFHCLEKRKKIWVMSNKSSDIELIRLNAINIFKPFIMHIPRSMS